MRTDITDTKKISTPLNDDIIAELKAGDSVLITGFIFTARDAAHKRLIELIKKGQDLPMEINGQIIYYVGPSPAKPGYPCGSAGPTTSYRMDPYTPSLLDRGLKGMIGKGLRSKKVVNSMKKNKAIYFAAVGGAAALIAQSIKKSEIVAYKELGPEAIFRFYVEDFPVIVAIDSAGNNLYETEPLKYKK
ncbi:MAG: Fe-S-containing hydro-lyase [Candidatus Caldatribacteriota bacterium]|nr:Fe-S-containing hydro-lyase [Candidatus Caldatribacteriota bacterium]